MRIAFIFSCVIWMLIAKCLTGCMQVTGAKKITLGTWVIEANNGFEAKAGVQQYDYVKDERGIGQGK
jgi:hypothetical protein